MSNYEEPVHLSPEQMAKVREAVESKLRGEPSYTIDQIRASIKAARESRNR
jgi:hypothetical protein